MEAPPYSFLYNVTLPLVGPLSAVVSELASKVGIKIGKLDTSFQEVTGLSKQSTPEEVQAGGENRYTYRLPGVITHPNLVLKRAVADMDSPLTVWCMATLEGGYSIPVVPLPLQVNLLKSDPKSKQLVPRATWILESCYPVSWNVSDLHSQSNELAIERVELAYTNLVRIPATSL